MSASMQEANAGAVVLKPSKIIPVTTYACDLCNQLGMTAMFLVE